MRALVLNSGGVDSTTCVGIAIKECGKENVSTVSVYYGQKHKSELDCAEKISRHYGVNHYTIDLSNTNIYNHSNCSLLEGSTVNIPHKSYKEQVDETKDGMVSTYVPFRNGLMLSSVAALAVSLYPDDEVDIYLGNHADDAAGNAYADCSADFVDTIGKAINIGTYNKVNLKSPLCYLNKAGVVKIGLDLNVPYHLTRSCYESSDIPCGLCGTDIDRINAFARNGVKDPVPYQIRIDWDYLFDGNDYIVESD